jgi:2-amino-4-hydroxy-6-hydroxymethyldihydropteridine diphosphokinase
VSLTNGTQLDAPPMARPDRGRYAAIALGSNLGDRASHLAFAVDRLRSVLSDVVVSAFVETAPEHDADEPPFLNGALVGATRATPEQLLSSLLKIESERGRTRAYAGAPRTLDLDLVLLGELTADTPTLTLPHPRFRSRLFVLGPLAEVAPGLVDPVTGRSVRELLQLLGSSQGERTD